MKAIIASSLIYLLSLDVVSIAQQTPAPAPTDPVATAPASSAPTAAGPITPQLPNTLMDGTPVKLRLGETVSSESAHVGQQVPFEVTDDVVVQGVTIIPKGTQALATVTEAEAKKRMGRGGKLNVNIDSTRLIDGERIQLRAIKDGKGGGHVGAMTGAMVATSIVFFPAAPLFLFMKGKDITIPKGTEVTAFVQGDTHLDMARLTSAPGVTQAGPAPNSPTIASLSVDASVPGADIELDGNFVGSTPSTLSVAPGQHTITVKKKGYSPWTRTMNIAGTSVRVTADLDKK